MTFSEALDPSKSSIVLAEVGGADVLSGGVVDPRGRDTDDARHRPSSPAGRTNCAGRPRRRRTTTLIGARRPSPTRRRRPSADRRGVPVAVAVGGDHSLGRAIGGAVALPVRRRHAGRVDDATSSSRSSRRSRSSCCSARGSSATDRAAPARDVPRLRVGSARPPSSSSSRRSRSRRLPRAPTASMPPTRRGCRSSSTSPAPALDGRPVVRVPARSPTSGPIRRDRRRRDASRRAWLRIRLRAIGLIGWLWIVAQGIAGGSGDGDVVDAVPVGLRLGRHRDAVGVRRPGLALARPVRDAPRPRRGRACGAVGIQRLGDRPSTRARLGRWPAVIGLVVLRLARARRQRRRVRARCSSSSSATPRFTLAMMAQFGRDAWRRDGETFTRLVRPPRPARAVRPRRRPDGGPGRRVGRSRRGLLMPGWRIEDLVLIAVGTGVDPVRRPVPDAAVVRRCSARRASPVKTLQLVGFLGLIVVAALLVSRLVGVAATGAGLLPIAAGYLIAHYFTYLLIDGQRIVIALADPLQQGWDLGNSAGRSTSRLGAGCRRASSGRSSSRRSSAGTCSGRGAATSWRRADSARPRRAQRTAGARCRSR